MVKSCDCGKFFDPEQAICVSVLGGKPVEIQTITQCIFCFKEWAEKYSQLCAICQKPFLPGEPVEACGDGYCHTYCGNNAAGFVGHWSEKGEVIPFRQA